jgi:hypothetical protein
VLNNVVKAVVYMKINMVTCVVMCDRYLYIYKHTFVQEQKKKSTSNNNQ